MSTLRTINQIMGIASKAHYLNGGNASKVLAKDKKGIFTIEQVAETLQCDPVELKQLLQQNDIMCGDYVINEAWGDGEKLSTFALRALTKPQKQSNFLGFKQPQVGQKASTEIKIASYLLILTIVLLIVGYPLLGVLTSLIMVCLAIKPAYEKVKEQYPEIVNKPIVSTIITILKVIGYVFVLGLGGMIIGVQLNYFAVTFVIWLLGIVIPIIYHYKK